MPCQFQDQGVLGGRCRPPFGAEAFLVALEALVTECLGEQGPGGQPVLEGIQGRPRFAGGGARAATAIN